MKQQGKGNRDQSAVVRVGQKGEVVKSEESMRDRNEAAAFQPFTYPDCSDAPFVPSWFGWDETVDRAEPEEILRGASDGRTREQEIAAPELERRLAEEARRSFESGRVQGIEEGRRAERAAQANALVEANAQRTRQVAALIETFAQERGRYFHGAEQEVVRLALAAAARILRREAESDPLFLIGAVRAALGQISGSTEVRLRVPAAEREFWSEAVGLLPHLSVKPKIEAGANMILGDCVIETSLGSADLGVRAQMAEIERALVGNSDSSAACAEPAA